MEPTARGDARGLGGDGHGRSGHGRLQGDCRRQPLREAEYMVGFPSLAMHKSHGHGFTGYYAYEVWFAVVDGGGFENK